MATSILACGTPLHGTAYVVDRRGNELERSGDDGGMVIIGSVAHASTAVVRKLAICLSIMLIWDFLISHNG